ncbi:MAG: MATE family efflux transporter, partial [Clostridium sp.]|nr:MATE family efflux transporter [Clostridium sp.]
ADCVLYGRIILLALPFNMLQFEFQTFFIVAEKPQLGLAVTVASGLTNMVLDALFMAVFKWGLVGAALATGLSQFVGGVLPLLYFSRPNSSLLQLCKAKMDGQALFKACTNGSSELMSNVSMSLVSMLYNIQLMKHAGENGVAAYGVIMYVTFIFIAVFIGFSTGIAPVISFHFGAANRSEVTGLLKRSFVIIGVLSASMLVVGEALSAPLSALFVGYDDTLMALTTRGMRFYAVSFLFSGIAIFGSSFFTALNDGLTSALISFLRSLLFQVAAVLLFPLIWGIDGIWGSIVAAELVAALVTVFFLAFKRKKFHY